MNDFRTALSEELSELSPPPLGDLVSSATHGGRRAARRRRAGAIAGSATVLAVVVGTALLTAPQWRGTGSPDAVSAAAAPSGTVSAPASPTVAPTAAETPYVAQTLPARVSDGKSLSATAVPHTGRPAAATGRAVLATVQGLLQPKVGKLSAPAARDVPQPGAQLYVTDADGNTGMVRVFLSKATAPAGCTEAGRTCSTDRRGQRVVVDWHSDNCLQATSVTVDHPDGTAAQVVLGTCLAWDGTSNPPGVLALTTQQAIELAGDPALSLTMDSGLVDAAQSHYRDVPSLT